MRNWIHERFTAPCTTKPINSDEWESKISPATVVHNADRFCAAGFFVVAAAQMGEGSRRGVNLLNVSPVRLECSDGC
jgi:hypothetical protein